jgi:hypothetical protein
MEMDVKTGQEQGAEAFDGMHTAYVVGAILLAATFWASPSLGVLFAVALLVCAAVCAVVLTIACAIGFCDSAVSRLWRRDEGKRTTRMPSRAATSQG